MPRLRTERLTIGYDRTTVITDLSVDIPDGRITAIVGPNACGKSTLLRGLAQLLKPWWTGDRTAPTSPRCTPWKWPGGWACSPDLHRPEGITVADLVARGRLRIEKVLRQWAAEDAAAVADAMRATNVEALSARLVDELSGGQRQRVWVAMVLAQQTPLLLLDEPTTYLDIAHQVELLDLFAALNREQGRTVVAVLHDLNHACRYADHIIAMKAGSIVAEGDPTNVITEALVSEVYGLACQIIDDPQTGTPLVVPVASPYLRRRR